VENTQSIFSPIRRWLAQGERVALVTVVKVYGSAPRPLGSVMLVSESGHMSGSVSGGCVESAVVQEAMHVLRSGQARLIAYGISDEQARGVGLACGGTIQVFLSPHLSDTLLKAVEQGRMVARVDILAGPGAGRSMLVWNDGTREGTLGADNLDAHLSALAMTAMHARRPERLRLDWDEATLDVFINVFPPPDTLVVVGAVHIAIPLLHMANALGWRTVVVDPRAAFATAERFAHADEIVRAWPQEALPRLGLNESTAVVTLSHDEKLDVPALQVALAHPVFYVGALGSRRTHARRVETLRALGTPEQAIARIHAPVGLDIGARTPEEIAVAILAQIVAVKNGRQREAGEAG